MKQKFIAFVVAALSLVMLFVSCQKVAAVTDVQLSAAPQKVSYYVNDTVDVTGGKLTYTYEDGNTEVKDVTADMVTGFDTTACGQKTAKISVTANGKDYSFDFTYTVTSANIDSLKEAIEELPEAEDVVLADKEAVDTVVAAYNAFSADEKAYFDATEEEAKAKMDEVVAALNVLVEADNQAKAELATYRAEKINAIKELLKVSVFDSVTTAPATTEEGKPYVASTLVAPVVDFTENEDVAAAIADIVSAISAIESKEAIDVAIDIAVADYFSAYKDDLVTYLTASVNKVVDAWKSTIATQLARWTEDSIGLANQFNPIPMDYYSENGRWWGAAHPEWNVSTIAANVATKFEDATTLEGVINTYTNIVFELTRATMQRNVEYFYAIERALNSLYDPNDVYYWNGVANYWSAETNMRLAWDLYAPDAETTTIEKAVEQYNKLMAYLAKDKLAVLEVTVDTYPVVVYEVGETLSVAGGKLAIAYNDPNENEVIDMTDAMLEGTVVFDTVEEGVAVLKFQTKAGEATYELKYSVVLDKNLGNAINTYQSKVDAEVDIFKKVFFNKIGGDLASGIWVSAKNETNISENEAIASAAKALKDAIAAAQTGDEAKAAYDNGAEAFKLALRNEYKRVAIADVKNIVTFMRDSVKSVWGTKDVANEDGTVTTTDVFTFESANGGVISTDYLDKSAAGHFNWHVPAMYNIAYVYDNIDFAVTADMTAEELYAAYDAAYFEVLRVVADRNVATVYFFNEAKLTDYNFWGGCLLWLYSEVVTEQGSVLTYDGPFDAFKGQTSEAFRLWYWSFTRKAGQACLNYGDLLYHYNVDVKGFLVA